MIELRGSRRLDMQQAENRGNGYSTFAVTAELLQYLDYHGPAGSLFTMIFYVQHFNRIGTKWLFEQHCKRYVAI